MGIPERRSEGQPMPLVDAKFVIMGLTNGPAFYPNPCLASQVAWTKERHLWAGAYSITSYPTAAELQTHGGSGTTVERLRRVGRAQAAFNVATMRNAGLNAPMVWVDVEPITVRPWSTSLANNNAVVDGTIAGYRNAGLRVGLYSYGGGWRQITGGRQLPHLPAWMPSGTSTYNGAALVCGRASFSGGPVWLGQSTDGRRDFNVTCAGVTGSSTRPNALTPYISTRLAVGSRGAAVIALQRRFGMSATGYFGSITKGKVMAFQRAKALPVTGVVTTATWRALGAGTTTPAAPSKMPLIFQST